MTAEIRWIMDRNPDSNKTVLVRLEMARSPIWIAFYQDRKWYYHGGGKIPKTIFKGWMHLEDAAAVLDNQTPVPK
jgi:hypothetical protein